MQNMPYESEINELPAEHSVDWQQFVSSELKENVTFGKADALLAFLTSIAPALGFTLDRWGAESKNGTVWIRSSEIRKITGPQVALKYVADIRCALTGEMQRVSCGLAWRRLYSSPLSDPSDRICAVLLDVIGLDKDGRNPISKNDILAELTYMRAASIDEGMLALNDLSEKANKTDRNG